MKKKLLLGALLVLGTVVNAQRIEELNAAKGAKIGVPIMISGKVVTNTGESLVVSIDESPNATGDGFFLEMDDLFAGQAGTAEGRGRYTAKTVKDGGSGVSVGYSSMTHKLMRGASPAGSSYPLTNGVALYYSLVITPDTALVKTEDKGIIKVIATATSRVTAGEYIHNELSLEIAVTGN